MWVYVGGLPRSGQTLLAYLIGLHPECHAFAQQTQFIHDILQWLAPMQDERGYKVRYTWTHDSFQHPRDNTLPVLLQYRSLDEVAGAILSGIEGLWHDVRYLVAGSPTNTDAATLRRLRPDARFIVTERSQEDCVRSVLNTHWGSSMPATQAAEFVARYVPFAAALSAEEGVLRVSHTTVQENHEQALRAVLDWLQLDPDCYPWGAAAERFAEGAAHIS